MDTRAALEFSGLPAVRLVSVEPWPRPRRADRNGPNISWLNDGRPVRTQLRDPMPLLITFASLHCDADADADVAPTAAIRFASRFGPLWLCHTHRLPMSHLDADTVSVTLADIENATGRPVGEAVEIHDRAYSASRMRWLESWRDWHHWSEGLDLLLRLIAACSDDPDRNLRTVNWTSLDGWWQRHVDHHGYLLPATASGEPRPPSVETAKAIAAFLVRRWLRWGNVSYALRWASQDPSPQLVLEADSLFGALAAEVAATALGSTDIEFCTNCGRPFQRLGEGRRRTQRNKNPYCDDPECRRAISRDSKRRLRSSSSTSDR